MAYKNANDIFPKELIEIIQKYVDGEHIYIPKKNNSRKKWGENTDTLNEINYRNKLIYKDYLDGLDKKVLAKKYFLSLKSIERIILQAKKQNNP